MRTMVDAFTAAGRRRRWLSVTLAIAMAVTPAAPGQAAADDLETGKRQIAEGDLQAAVVTLRGLVQALTPDAATRAKDLSQAHLYLGVAYVGLAEEDRAKESFREALRHDPALRLAKGQFPDRVVRVFEAARTGKTKSVLDRPSDAPKKAGLGAAGIALIVVGGVALAGGAAAVATRSGPPPTTAPTPTVTGRWEGTYTWDCGFAAGRGSSPIIFVLNEANGRITGGSATYLAGVSSVSGSFSPATMQVLIDVARSPNFVNNRFSGTLAGSTISGTTQNGDSGISGGCSAPTGPSGTFSVSRR